MSCQFPTQAAPPLPGDDLIPAPKLDSTHAITIHAPADQVWPWLAQMGYEDRAGTYSYDPFERRAGRNLDRLDPDIQPLATGGVMPFAPGMPMTVAVADPPHALVLWQVTSSGKAIDPTGPWGDDHVAWTWAFILEPVDPATTRLLIRMRASYQPLAKWGPYMWLLVEPAHFIMGRRQLLGIRQRAQAARPPGAHQATRAGQLPNLATMPTSSAWCGWQRPTPTPSRGPQSQLLCSGDLYPRLASGSHFGRPLAQGMSTRKVDDLVRMLGADSGIRKSEATRICADLDAEIGPFPDPQRY